MGKRGGCVLTWEAAHSTLRAMEVAMASFLVRGEAPRGFDSAAREREKEK